MSLYNPAKTNALYRSSHLLLFLIFGTYSYIFHFDRALRDNKSFRKHQIKQEIKESIFAIFAMDIVNIPVAMLQINGHSFLYNSTSNGLGLWYELLQYPLAILFMDTGIYWLHWAFHSPFLYSYAHKAHHRYGTRVARVETRRVMNSLGSLFPLHSRPSHFIPWKLAS